MKRFISLLAAAVLLTSISAEAQNKGDLFIGGDINFTISSTSITGTSGTDFSLGIAPEVGYFPINNLKVGGHIGYSLSNGIHSLSILPSVGYYLRLCDNVYYTPTLHLGYVYGNYSGFSMSGFGLQLAMISVECKLSQHCALSINALSLSYAVLSKYGETANNVTFGFSPSVGFRYYF